MYPGVDLRVDYEMHAVLTAAITDSVRQAGVDLVTVSFFEEEAFSSHVEFHASVGVDRDM